MNSYKGDFACEFVNNFLYGLSSNDKYLKENINLEPIINTIISLVCTGTIFKLREIPYIENFVEYIEPSEKQYYYELLNGKIEPLNHNVLQRQIEELFRLKKESQSPKTISNIIDLLIGHKCIEIWEYLFYNDNYIISIMEIDMIYTSLIMNNKKIYDNLYNEFVLGLVGKHECIDFKLNSLNQNHKCMICGNCNKCN